MLCFKVIPRDLERGVAGMEDLFMVGDGCALEKCGEDLVAVVMAEEPLMLWGRIR